MVLPGVPLEPASHQAEAVDASVAELRDGGRATVVMACGSGKTLVGAEVARALAAACAVVFTPSIALIKQSMALWARQRPLAGARVLCVCSDETVGLPDEARVTTGELGQPVTTDPLAIRTFLDAPGPVVVFSTYHSAPLLAAGLAGGRTVDLAVFDEAHRTAGVDGRGFAFPLSDARMPIARRLFLTATPRQFEAGDDDGDGDWLEARSMDDEQVYGRVVYRLSMLEAVRRDIIVDLQVVISFVEPTAHGDGRQPRAAANGAGAAREAGDHAQLLALRKFALQYQVAKVFTFHRTIAEAQRFTATAQQLTPDPQCEADLQALHINGMFPTAQREAIMARFGEASRAQLSSVRCLSEGVDVPAVDAVALMARKKSKLNIVQICGRAMRKAGPEKKCGYLLLPLVLGAGGTATQDQTLSSDQLQAVLEIVEALQECDDSVRDALVALRRQRGRGEEARPEALHSRIVVDGPADVLSALRRALVEQVVTRLTSTWDESYGALEAYHDRHGHARVPRDYRTADNFGLGLWLVRQRARWRAGALPAARVRALERLGVSWRLLDERFDALYARLEAFHAIHGHCRVTPATDPALAQWVRSLRKRGARAALPAEQVARLDRLDFQWRIQRPRTALAARLESLRRYRAEHGHVEVQRVHDEALYDWIKHVRALRGSLSAERVALLDDAGFPWGATDTDWEAMVAQLQRVHMVAADAGVEPAYDGPLQRWVALQRHRYRAGSLTADQVAVLESAGLIVDQWRMRLRELERFKAEFGHCRPPAGSELAKWLKRQWRADRLGVLAPGRKALLEESGVRRGVKGVPRAERLRQLQAYKDEYGHCRVPFKSENGLGRWLCVQRWRRRSGVLDPQLLAQLDAMGVIW